jgi:hypothetical protein
MPTKSFDSKYVFPYMCFQGFHICVSKVYTNVFPRFPHMCSQDPWASFNKLKMSIKIIIFIFIFLHFLLLFLAGLHIVRFKLYMASPVSQFKLRLQHLGYNFKLTLQSLKCSFADLGEKNRRLGIYSNVYFIK